MVAPGTPADCGMAAGAVASAIMSTLPAHGDDCPTATDAGTPAAAAVLALLQSPDFDVVDYAGRCRTLAARLGIGLEDILFAYAHLPLCLRGSEHLAKRRAVARHVASAQPALFAALPGLVRRHLAMLGQPGRHDVLNGAIRPLVRDVVAAFVGERHDTGAESLMSRVFSAGMGVAKRRRLNDEIAALRAAIAAAQPELSAGDVGIRVALHILGSDALTGTLANSLAQAVADSSAAGRPLVIGPAPTRTGVPFVDRQALRDTEHGGRAVARGDTVTARLDVFDGAGEDADRMFGAGAHVCLGRPVSLRLWSEIRDFVNPLDSRVGLRAFVLRKDDVFRLPDVFEIEVTGDG